MTLDKLTAIGTAGARMAEVGREAPDTEVSRYPGRTVLDVIRHTGQIHRRTTQVVAERLSDRPDLAVVPEGDVIVWFEEGLEEMVGVLSTTDSAIVCWGFGDTPNVGFWVTRMLIETEVHRWDVESGPGDAAPIPTDIAVEAIDEARFMAFGRIESASGGQPGPIATFHATDADRRWTLVQLDTGFDLVEGEGAGATIRASASNLYLAMVGRDHGPLEEAGPHSDLARWRAVVDLMADAAV